MEARRKIAVIAALALAAGGCPKKGVTAKPSAKSLAPVPAEEPKAEVAGPEVPPLDSPRAPNASIYFARGVQLADSEPDLAIGAFREAIRAKPDLYVAHYNLAVVAERKGDDVVAERHYKRCLAISSDYAPALANYIKLLVRQGQSARAVRVASLYGTKHPKRLDFRYLKTKALIAAGRERQAVREAKAILREDEKNIGAMIALSAIFQRQGKYELAAHAMRQALKVDPENPEAHHRLGHALLAQNERTGALQAFQKAVELKADFPEALNSLAVMLIDRDRGKALNHLEEAVRLAPNFWQAHLNLGNAYRKSGQLAKAKQAYLKVRRLRPGNADALYNLALLYLDHAMPDAPSRIGQLERSLSYFEKYRIARHRLPREDPARRYVAFAKRKLNQLRRERRRQRERDRLKRLRKELQGSKLKLGGK